MPNDVFYGADAELRVGLMADKDTDPTAWSVLEFMQFTAAPATERKERPKLGAARNNPLDPIKPRKGLSRVGLDVVLDADTVQLPRWLRETLGPPTTGSVVGGIYPHVWTSGVVAPQYCAIQVRPNGSSKVYVYRGVTFGALAFSFTGEQTQDFDVQLSLKGLSRARIADWLSGTVTAAPAEAPVYRTVFRADGVAASNTLQASWTWDRQLAEDLFASTTATVSGLRPGGGTLSGTAKFRALAEAFEDMEEADQVFAPDVQMLGTATGHEVVLAHPHAELQPAQLAIQGAGLIERDWSWTGHQDASTPGARITVKNGVASYAT